MFWLLVADRGLVLVAGENAYRHWLLAGRHLCQRVGCFAEPPWDVIVLETIELVLQLVDLSSIRSHLGVVAA